MNDTIDRKMAIDFFLSKGMITAAVYVERMPSVQQEPLTDKEQRIFLAAMGREEKVCKQVDNECKYFIPPYELSLEKVCKEITRKVKKTLWTN
jgi:hypothetical protein